MFSPTSAAATPNQPWSDPPNLFLDVLKSWRVVLRELCYEGNAVEGFSALFLVTWMYTALRETWDFAAPLCLLAGEQPADAEQITALGFLNQYHFPGLPNPFGRSVFGYGRATVRNFTIQLTTCTIAGEAFFRMVFSDFDEL